MNKSLSLLCGALLGLHLIAPAAATDWGEVPAGSTVPCIFESYGASGESLTLTNLIVGDIEIIKGGSVTVRSSDSGYALIDTDGIDIGSRTGFHGFTVDTSDNTDSGFYSAGGFFNVFVDAVTINSQTVRLKACTFRLVSAENTAGVRTVDTVRWANQVTASDDIALLAQLAKTTHITGFNDIAGSTVQTEAEEALQAYNLDHLVGSATGIPALPSGTYLDLALRDGSATYDRTTDSLQAIRDHIGNGTNLTEAGGTGDQFTGLPAVALTQAAREAIILTMGIPAPTTIATLASQISFTLAAGSSDDNAYNGFGIIIRDSATAAQQALGCVRDYTGSTKTVTLLADPAIFTMATSDNVSLIPAYCTALVQQNLIDSALLTCTVDDANFSPTTTAVACDLTDRDGVAVTSNIADNDFEGLELKVLSGAQRFEGRFIIDSDWDGSNNEMRLTLSRALPSALVDGVTAIIR